MKEKPNVQYDFIKKRQITFRSSLRGLVSLYLGFLSWDLVKGGPDASDMPYWGRLLAAAVFVAVAVFYGLRTWRGYQEELKDAILTEEEVAQLEKSQGQEPSATKTADESAEDEAFEEEDEEKE